MDRLGGLLLSFVLLSSLVFVFPVQPVKAEDTNGQTNNWGINYLSTYNHYEPQYLSDEQINQDFSLFQNQGITYLTLCAFWKQLEPKLGEYNDTALAEIQHVCDLASNYNFKVIIDFHTKMNNNSWTMPTWLSPCKFETVFFNSTIQEAWLNFLDHCASQLNDTTNIWSWHMMNEPARGNWACNVSIDDFVALWQNMSAIFKSYSNRPVSIRFAANMFTSINQFNSDPRIFQVCDYLSLNFYDYNCPRATLSSIVSTAKTNNISVLISEFGSNSTDEATQASDYQSLIAFFRSLGINDYAAWCWKIHVASNETPENFTICNSATGTPKPAFYLLDDLITNASTDCYLIVRGENDNIYYRTYDSISETWNGWSSLPGSTLSSPAAYVIGNQLHIVVRGVNNDQIWYGNVNLNDNSFSGWTLMSGTTPSPPTLTGNSTHLCLVVRGNNDIIYYRFYNLESRVWSDWEAVPDGTTLDTPAVELTNDALQIVVRGSNYDQIWHGSLNIADNSFSGWSLLSGATPSPPTLTGNITTLCLVVRGENNVIYYRWYDFASKVWSDWTGFLYGTTPDVPAATVMNDNLQIVVRGMNYDQIWHGTLSLTTNAWSDWTQLDGSTPSNPVLVC